MHIAKSSTQTIFTDDLSTMDDIFLSRSQMLLLLTFMEFDFNRVEALIELNFIEAVSILDTNRFVFPNKIESFCESLVIAFGIWKEPIYRLPNKY